MWAGPPLDGPQLIAAADLVVSAGGSMNREAAVLGTPAASIYAGEMAAVDERLVNEGRMILLRSPGDLARLRLSKKPVAAVPAVGEGLLRAFVDRLLVVANG